MPNVLMLTMIALEVLLLVLLLRAYRKARDKQQAILLLAVTGILFVWTITAVVLHADNVSAEAINKASGIGFFLGVTMLVTVYTPVKNIYEKFTKKIFYKGAYDAQTLIDSLNKELVTDVEIESLIEKTNEILREVMMVNYSGFYIRETAYFPKRYISEDQKRLNQGELETIRQLLPFIQSKIFSTSKQPTNKEEKALIEILNKNKIEILGRLVSTTKLQVAGVGYFLLGKKKNGVKYSAKDLKVLEIIANELILAIENSLRLEEIEQFNVTLQKKIDAATGELRASNAKLQELDEAKDEFVSMASHQLRTPLTSVKGYISMVLEGDAGKISDTQRQMLGQAFFSSQRMVYLISDLLNMSRLKTGKFIIEHKPVYLPDIVESELSQLNEGISAKGLTLSYDKPKSFPTLSLDEMKLRQVVMNFTDNAIYYTPSGGKITVGLKDGKDTVEFTVKDTGMGVPKEEQHKLFAKFYRAENARKARPDGTGLGLFMAKKVIIAQGGSIIFDSKEGKGSTFGFSFPKSKTEIKSEDEKMSEAPSQDTQKQKD